MWSLLAANLKMMARDRQALFWALVFPFVLVMVFGVFDIGGLARVSIAIIDHANTESSRELSTNLQRVDYLVVDPQFDSRSDSEARAALEDGELEYVLIIPGTNPQRDELLRPILLYDLNIDLANELVIGAIQHFVDSENLQVIQGAELPRVETVETDTRRVEYFDTLLIGLVGMGIMTNSIIFIAVKISMYRNQSVLRRMLATPLKVRNYFASEVITHLVLSLIQAGVVIAAGVYVYNANIHGNLLWLFLIVAFANTVFLNIGFVISAWATNPRAASGMGNAIAIPMMFFAGTFFPTSSLPGFLPDLVRVLPLTPMLDAMRSVALDGREIWHVWQELAMLVAWLAVSSAAAIKLFRFG